MIAIDTNVVVRFLVADDQRQADRAEAVLRRGPVLVPKTVLLETEWVLRGAYRLASADIAVGFRKLLGLAGVGVEDAAAVRRAMDWYDRGFDFADALHLASAGVAKQFATFDVALARRAKGLADAPVVVKQ